MKTIHRRFFCFLACLGGLALWTGCAGYRLGPTNGRPAGEESIQINPFQNQTMEPHLSDAVTTALRNQLQQDGTYRLDTHGDGDVIVTGVITDYRRSGLTFLPGDVLTVRDFDVLITVHVRAMERYTGKVLMDKDVTGRTTVRVGSDLTSAERQGRTQLAADLARNITSALVDGSW